jgi:hypothetical protein
MIKDRAAQKLTLIVAAACGLSAFAYADAFSDHLRTAPSAIDRPMQNRMAEPEYTGSFRTNPMQPQLTKRCSYDTYYWGTIYACDPTHNPADPIFIEQERRNNGPDHNDQNAQ